LTLTVTRKINVGDSDEFEQERDDAVERLEAAGWTVDVSANDDADYSEEEDGDDAELELGDDAGDL
jgi:hypothetical protein